MSFARNNNNPGAQIVGGNPRSNFSSSNSNFSNNPNNYIGNTNFSNNRPASNFSNGNNLFNPAPPPQNMSNYGSYSSNTNFERINRDDDCCRTGCTIS